jgi:hypothetical protein
VDIDAAVERRQSTVQHLFGELLARYDLTGMTQQGFEKRKLRHGQVQRLAGAPGLPRHRIKGDIADVDPRRRIVMRPSAPQNSSHPRQQLARVERLGQIIVRAKLQPHNSIDVFSTRGQDQYRDIRLRAQLAEHVESLHAR